MTSRREHDSSSDAQHALRRLLPRTDSRACLTCLSDIHISPSAPLWCTSTKLLYPVRRETGHQQNTILSWSHTILAPHYPGTHPSTDWLPLSLLSSPAAGPAAAPPWQVPAAPYPPLTAAPLVGLQAAGRQWSSTAVYDAARLGMQEPSIIQDMHGHGQTPWMSLCSR